MAIVGLLFQHELNLLPQDNVENDFMSSISDPNVREVIAKETLTYKPKERHNPEQEAKNVKALENLIEVSQSKLESGNFATM